MRKTTVSELLNGRIMNETEENDVQYLPPDYKEINKQIKSKRRKQRNDSSEKRNGLKARIKEQVADKRPPVGGNRRYRGRMAVVHTKTDNSD